MAAAGLLLLYGFLSGSGIFRNLTDPGYLTAVALIVFVTFPIHEYAHAAMAVRLGDNTPVYQGRYTLNPLAHIDPFGAILLLFSGFGWAKPVQWQPRNVNIDPRIASILVALAGPISNLVLAVITLILVSSFLPSSEFIDQMAGRFVYINVLLFVFNMIPVPPLDGSHVLFALLPGDLYQVRVVLSQFGMLIILVLIFSVPSVITGPTVAIMQTLAALIL